MSEKKKHSTRFYVYHTMMLLVMILIFFFSAQNGEESSQISNGFLRWLLSVIGKVISEGFSEWLTLWIRKTAHFSIYLLLGFCTSGMAAAKRSEKAVCRKKGRFGISSLFRHMPPGGVGWLIAVGYAFTDEFHQLFVPGRAGLLTDVLIDSCGALTGILLLAMARGVLHLFEKKC